MDMSIISGSRLRGDYGKIFVKRTNIINLAKNVIINQIKNYNPDCRIKNLNFYGADYLTFDITKNLILTRNQTENNAMGFLAGASIFLDIHGAYSFVDRNTSYNGNNRELIYLPNVNSILNYSLRGSSTRKLKNLYLGNKNIDGNFFQNLSTDVLEGFDGYFSKLFVDKNIENSINGNNPYNIDRYNSFSQSEVIFIQNRIKPETPTLSKDSNNNLIINFQNSQNLIYGFLVFEIESNQEFVVDFKYNLPSPTTYSYNTNLNLGQSKSYKIISVDEYFNLSEFSDLLTITN